LDDGIDPNIRNDKDPWKQGRQLLIFAAINGHVDLIKLLLSYGAEVDGTDFHGRTALSWASEYCQYWAVKILVEHGADVNTKDKEQTTPLTWLNEAGNGENINEMREYLVRKGAKAELHYG
jgi:ankyrin repeat protein